MNFCYQLYTFIEQKFENFEKLCVGQVSHWGHDMQFIDENVYYFEEAKKSCFNYDYTEDFKQSFP